MGDARRNDMVRIPEADTIEELNERMMRRCEERLGKMMAGRAETVGRLLDVERRHLRPLPPRPLFVGTMREVVASSTSRVRFETNQYSVLASLAYERLTLKADPFRVWVYRGEEPVAEHRRSYGRYQVVDDWRHYLPLLLRKPAAVPHASPLRGAIPPAWEAFRKELTARGRDGNREFARVLELCLTHSTQEVGAAIELATSAGGYSVDAIKSLLSWAGEEPQQSRPLDGSRYPEYQVRQPIPDVSAYNRLLEVTR